MLYIDKGSQIKMSGDSDDLLLELAQALVSYQYCFDSAKNDNKRSIEGLINTICDLAEIATNLYTDDEYYDIVSSAYTNVIDASKLNTVLKSIKPEE